MIIHNEMQPLFNTQVMVFKKLPIESRRAKLLANALHRKRQSLRRAKQYNLAKDVIELFPKRPGLLFGFFFGDQLSQIQFTNARVQIHVVSSDDLCPEIQLMRNIKGQDYRKSQVSLKPVPSALLWGHFSPANGRETDPELCQ